MDGDGDRFGWGRLGMEFKFTGTVWDGDKCLSPCSPLVRGTYRETPVHDVWRGLCTVMCALFYSQDIKTFGSRLCCVYLGVSLSVALTCYTRQN